MPSILTCFPENFQPRLLQKKILEDIESKITSGYKTIILSAPTGVGKSLVAATVAKYFGRSFIVTASKHLQDQYSQELSFIKPVKGKSNFPCLKLMEHEQINENDFETAVKRELTCEKGLCEETVTKNKKKIKEICKFKPKITDFEDNIPSENKCQYYVQKFLGLISDHSVWNYSSYFQLMKFNKNTFSDYIDRPIAIFDEAHKIEDQIIQFIGIDISSKHIEECGIDVEHYDLNDIDLIIKLLDNLAESYSKQLKDIEQNTTLNSASDYERIKKLEDKYNRMADARVEILSNKDNFVINEPQKDKNEIFKSISIRPLDISKYVESYFDIKNRIFMSATIDKESFCENTGIKQSEVAFIDAPTSPFSLENRKINFLNISKLSLKSNLDDEMAVSKKIDEILTKHSDQKGLILTSSKIRCYNIINQISPKNKKRVRICHTSNQNGKTQDQILKEHSEDSDGVLLSSSLWEGVDLKDDLSRFQIIAKTPYPNLSDKRVKTKMEKFPLWYKAQTIMKLLQGFGRSIRSEDDWAVTYVLDSAALTILNQYKTMVPKAYYDVLGWK
jgi:Rad3-related DNA helicase